MTYVDFSVESLITFLHLVDGNSFSTTARHLGVSPSTVSGHLASLETSVGEALLIRRRGPGGESAPTTAGRELAAFARPLVEAHRRTIDHFSGMNASATVRLAIADDIAAVAGVGDALRSFRRRHPGAAFELTVGQSSNLLRRLRAGQFDIALVKRLPADDDAVILRREAICWTVHIDAHDPPPSPLPLVAYPATASFMRNRAVQRLDAAGIPWRIANVVRGVNGALTAVRAGIGVGVFAEEMLPPDLVAAPPGWNLPELGTVETVIARRAEIPAAGVALLEGLARRGADLLR
ncbi:MAG: LysR family transcriptional regulator [Microbacterium sp.]